MCNNQSFPPVIDHTMNLCQLPRLNFNGKVYATELTAELMNHIMVDGIKIHEKTIELLNKSTKKGKKIIPYMNLKSKDDILSMVQCYGYEEWIKINDNIRFKFIGNGHISASSSIIIEVKDGYEKETIFYSGDTSGVRRIPYTKKLDLANKKYAFTSMILESTYGDNYIPQKSEEEIIDELYSIIKRTCIEKNGKHLLPVFSLARSTNVLLYLKKTYEKYPDISHINIYGISPLMKKCHESIGKNSEFYDEEWESEMDLFSWNKITMISEAKDMIRIGTQSEPCIICAASGMGTMGMNAFLLPEIIKSKRNSVSFTGYLAEGTEGYKLINKQQKTLTSVIDGKKVTVQVRASLSNISGLSSHCSGQEILEELKKTEKKKVKNIILVHGDKERCENFKKILHEYYNNSVNIILPKNGQNYKL